MAQATNSWWWLPGALMSLAGLLFIVNGSWWGNAVIWIPVGAAFICLAVFSVHRSRPRTEEESSQVRVPTGATHDVANR